MRQIIAEKVMDALFQALIKFRFYNLFFHMKYT